MNALCTLRNNYVLPCELIGKQFYRHCYCYYVNEYLLIIIRKLKYRRASIMWLLKIWTDDNLKSSKAEKNTHKYIIFITSTYERLGVALQ